MKMKKTREFTARYSRALQRALQARADGDRRREAANKRAVSHYESLPEYQALIAEETARRG